MVILVWLKAAVHWPRHQIVAMSLGWSKIHHDLRNIWRAVCLFWMKYSILNRCILVIYNGGWKREKEREKGRENVIRTISFCEQSYAFSHFKVTLKTRWRSLYCLMVRNLLLSFMTSLTIRYFCTWKVFLTPRNILFELKMYKWV